MFDEIQAHLHLSTLQVEVMIAQFYVGAAIGGLLTGRLADAYGRLAAVALTSILFIVGILFQACATSFESLLIGRAIAGLGAGVSWAGCGILASEIAPVRIRGLTVGLVGASGRWRVRDGTLLTATPRLTSDGATRHHPGSQPFLFSLPTAAHD